MILEAAHGVAESYLRMQGFRRERRAGMSAFSGGFGPPMVLLHGALSRGATTWGLVAGRLARRFHVIVPDLPGFGASQGAMPAECVTVPSIAEYLEGALPEWTGGERTYLAGGSLGGWIAARMALARPGTVAHLILVNAAGHWLDEDAGRGLADVITPETAEALSVLYQRVVARRMPVPRLLARDMIRTYRRDFAALRNLCATGEEDILTDAELGGLMPPTTVIWGAKDQLIPVEEGRALASAIPGSTFEVIEGCAHVPQVEAAGRFVAVVERVTSG